MEELDGVGGVPEMTVKVIGHQWYWGYEIEGNVLEMESRMLPDLVDGGILQPTILDGKGFSAERLLSVDRQLFVPANRKLRLLVTSADVIHSWSVPSFGIKVDAVPGRLNETLLTVLKPGVFYGQCSELCGVNHAFMPISVYVMSDVEYEKYGEFAETILTAKYMTTRPHCMGCAGEVTLPYTPTGLTFLERMPRFWWDKTKPNAPAYLLCPFFCECGDVHYALAEATPVVQVGYWP